MVWLMNGTSVASGVNLATIPPEWKIATTGDFNNDGKADLVWQNTSTGERSIWLMNGTTVSTSAGLGVTPIAWSIGANGDFNFDGQTDLVVQNTTTNEAVRHEIHGPAHISARWLRQGLTLEDADALTLAPTYCKTSISIEPIDALTVDLPAFPT
jgi:hypothetical protein